MLKGSYVIKYSLRGHKTHAGGKSTLDAAKRREGLWE